MNVKTLTDEQLVANLHELARNERRSLRSFLAHLSEFHERRLAGKTRHATTFMYCTQELRLTESEAYRRMQVVGVIDRFPALLDLIESGRLTLTTASLLCPHLNKSNFQELTSRAGGKSKRDVEFIVASLAPRHLPGAVVRPVAAPEPPIERSSLISEENAAPPASTTNAAVPTKVEALSGESARIHLTVSRTLLDKLERARALLRHRYPFAEYNDIIDAALEALLDRKDPDRK